MLEPDKKSRMPGKCTMERLAGKGEMTGDKNWKTYWKMIRRVVSGKSKPWKELLEKEKRLKVKNWKACTENRFEEHSFWSE